MLVLEDKNGLRGVVRGKAARVLGEDVVPVPGGKAAALLGLESPKKSPRSVRTMSDFDVGIESDVEDESSFST